MFGGWIVNARGQSPQASIDHLASQSIFAPRRRPSEPRRSAAARIAGRSLATPSRASALAALALIVAVSACERSAPQTARSEAGPKSPHLIVRAAPVADLKVVAATVAFRDQAEARARIGGTLVALNVREGDVVRRGQKIGQVTDQRLTFQVRAAEAEVAAAAAEAARAESELKRATYLFDRDVYAKARLDAVEAQAKAAQGALVAARAQRDASAEAARQGNILAPSDGKILRADTPAGSVVTPGQSVATLTAGPPVLRIEIPETAARNLKVGQAVSIVPGDLPGASHGVVSQIYPAVTAGRVVADVTSPELRSAFVGQRVRVRLPMGERRAILIPRSYVAHRYGLDLVRVIDRGGRTLEVAVQLAPSVDPGRVEVLSGLADGDALVPPGV